MSVTPSPEPKYLIAHRGGVVDKDRSENSFSALEEAIRRGYTHVEIDARITADQELVCFHNDDLHEEAGIPGKISEMELEEVARVTLARSGEHIPTFDEYCARCADRIGVMVDIKGCESSAVDTYTDKLHQALDRHGLMRDALILINKTPVHRQAEIAEHFLGLSRVAWRLTSQETTSTASEDDSFSGNHYVFNHGEDFTESGIETYQGLGLDVIASVNLHHYGGVTPVESGLQHIRQLRKWGVDGFQIDSVYDTEFFD